MPRVRGGILVGLAVWLVAAVGMAAEPVPRAEHPRPDFRRDRWLNLNGEWQFRFDPEDRGLTQQWFSRKTGDEAFREGRRIVVPFGWQSKLSGVLVKAVRADAGVSDEPVAKSPARSLGWYRRTVQVPEAFSGKGQRVWLRFGAVDWEARVWVNGQEVGRHEGGYTPFEFDVTPWAKPGREATIVVRVLASPEPWATDPELPRGKQGGRWHTSTSGIWQTVWLEARPAIYLRQMRLTPQQRGRQWLLEAELEVAHSSDSIGPVTSNSGGRVELEIVSPDPDVQTRRASLELEGGSQGPGTAVARITIEVNSPKLWTPEDPHLYDLEIRLTGSPASKVATDTVHTYFGLRTIARGKYGDLPHEVILLNGSPIYLRGALDPSFNPEGIYTAPSDEFMRRDMEIAKAAGFNFLRIHVKPEEPRRLYWADRLGVLIMEDMPRTWQSGPRARQAWAQTMRATIQRDRNHPAVIAWCLFGENESWGLGPALVEDDGPKTDRDARAWVLRTFNEVKQKLDPSRLVSLTAGFAEDNSPTRYDRGQSDVNSWHFTIDDYRLSREHIGKVVKNTRGGSALNYVPGRARRSSDSKGTIPLLNLHYGAVSARGGDQDISWGFRYLTTQLRRHGPIQGYVYAGLSDVEWAHNGVVNYDRSAKEFGYDAFVPGMTVADLQGPDFVGFDAPPVFELAPGEAFTVPIFISHFSRRTDQPSLDWQIVGTDNRGQPVITDVQTERVTWQPYRVTFQKPLRCRVPSSRPFVGALVLELVDADGRRLAANFMNLIVRQPTWEDFEPSLRKPSLRKPSLRKPSLQERRQPQPSKESSRVEVLGPRLVAVRFDPGDFASFQTDDPGWDWLDDRGKFSAYGACELEYHLALPLFVREAIPTRVALMAELATRDDAQRLDWPAVRRPLDYPQTQARKHPGRLGVRMLDRELWQFELPDDPADSRGVLSHHELYQRGSYGYLVRRKADLTSDVAWREALRDRPVVPLVFRTLGEGRGLSIYGARLGRYLIDPTIIIQTARDLTHSPGWSSGQSVMIHRLLDKSRLVQGIRTSEDGGHTWRWTTGQPPADWAQPGFDDASWRTDPRPVSTPASRGPASKGVDQRTAWTTPDVWLRSEMELPSQPMGVRLQYLHDEGLEIYVNGKLLLRATGEVRDYRQRMLKKAEIDLFHEGHNTIAVHGCQTGGGKGIDLGISWVEVGDEKP